MIKTTNLGKTFPGKGRNKAPVEAVKNLNFEVGAGEVFGLLGPNGAGKTTTMRMLSTLLSPSTGEVEIAGHRLSENQPEIRKNIGYVSQVGGMERESTGRQNLNLQALLYGFSKKDAVKRVNEVMNLLNIDGFADRKTSTYSGGQRRLFDLAAGIIHRPKLLFLDEPSTGLDPQNRVHMWEQIKKLNDQGTTIFVTTHYLEEADSLCDRVAIVDHGTIAAIGTPEDLKKQISGDIITLQFGNESQAKQAHDTVSANYVREKQIKENVLNIFVDKGDENLPMVLKTLHESGFSATNISLSRPTLDDVFLKLTGRKLRESEN